MSDQQTGSIDLRVIEGRVLCEETASTHGLAVHEDCVPDAVREEPPRPTCPKCWQIVSVSGACGCDPE